MSAIDTERREVRTAAGAVLRYTDLVSTLPLPRLVQCLVDAPREVREAAAGLRATSVLNVNLGVARPDLTDRHWVYYPEASVRLLSGRLAHRLLRRLGPSGLLVAVRGGGP